MKQNIAFLFTGEWGLFLDRGEKVYTKRADLKGRLSLHIHLLSVILELLFVVPICGQHTQVAAVAPLSVLLSGSEELGCLGWVLLHH